MKNSVLYLACLSCKSWLTLLNVQLLFLSYCFVFQFYCYLSSIQTIYMNYFQLLIFFTVLCSFFGDSAFFCSFCSIFSLDMQSLLCMREKVSSCLTLVLQLSHFLPYCGLSYLGLLTGCDVDTIIDIVLKGKFTQLKKFLIILCHK